MLIFFTDHPIIGKQYLFTDILTGDTETRTVQKRVKRSRYSDVFKCKQIYFEVTMTDEHGTAVTAEYEIDS